MEKCRRCSLPSWAGPTRSSLRSAPSCGPVHPSIPQAAGGAGPDGRRPRSAPWRPSQPQGALASRRMAAARAIPRRCEAGRHGAGGTDGQDVDGHATMGGAECRSGMSSMSARLASPGGRMSARAVGVVGCVLLLVGGLLAACASLDVPAPTPGGAATAPEPPPVASSIAVPFTGPLGLAELERIANDLVPRGARPGTGRAAWRDIEVAPGSRAALRVLARRRGDRRRGRTAPDDGAPLLHARPRGRRRVQRGRVRNSERRRAWRRCPSSPRSPGIRSGAWSPPPLPGRRR